MGVPYDDGMGDFDIEAMVKDAYDPATRTVRDFRLDDRDLPRAKNFYDYCYTCLNPDIAKIPFARQMWIALHLMMEICPVCSNKEWFHDVESIPVDLDPRELVPRLTLMEHGICPTCHGHRSYFVKTEQINWVRELILKVGQRAGKSTITANITTYLIHCYLKLPALAQMARGIDGMTPLIGTFIAGRAEDAVKLLWKPISKAIESSPWFTEYHKMLDYTGKKYGKEMFRIRDLSIKYYFKNLEFYPSGPTKRGLRGPTRIITATDEIGWFPITMDGQTNDGAGDREKADANEVYFSLDRSLLTVRDEAWRLINMGYDTIFPGYNLTISSPSSEKDKISTLYETNKNSKSSMALWLATWEVSPIYTRHHPEIIKAYADDYVAAERDYAANPPIARHTFIKDEGITACFKHLNRAGIETVDAVVNGKNYRAAKLNRIQPPNEIPPSIMAIDAGSTNNSFAVVVGHREGRYPVADVMIEIPTAQTGMLHYNGIYLGVIKPLIEEFNVKMLFADRWQSIALLHRAQEECELMLAEQYSVTMRDFYLVRSLLQNGDFRLGRIEREIPKEQAITNYPEAFKDAPMAHLLFQCFTVVDLRKSVGKGVGFTDDLFRAMSLFVSRIFNPKIWEEIEKLPTGKREAVYLGTVSARSGATGVMNRNVNPQVSARIGRLGSLSSRG